MMWQTSRRSAGSDGTPGAHRRDVVGQFVTEATVLRTVGPR